MSTNTVNPVLPLTEQLLADKKAPLRATESAFLGENLLPVMQDRSRAPGTLRAKKMEKLGK